MNIISEPLLRAIDHNLQTGEKQEIEASAIKNPDNENHRYYCIDCAAKNLQVRLKYVQAASRERKFSEWDKKSGKKILDDDGHEKEISLTYRSPPHFDRWPGAARHMCENPVRYEKFTSFSYRRNATPIGPYQYIYPLALPGAPWHHKAQLERVDLRRSFRAAGLDWLGGVNTPQFFKRLADFCQEDPGLQGFQHFHDGLTIRRFDETYFETAAALHNFLVRKKAEGLNESFIVGYRMNPNTHFTALKDREAANGMIDRSVPKAEDNAPIKLFVRTGNRETNESLKKCALRNGRNRAAPIIVLGEAYLHPDKQHQVEINIFHPDQVCGWDKPYDFYPKVKSSGISRLAVMAQQATLAL